MARAQWLDYSCPSTVQGWADGSANNGFVVYQVSGEGQTYWRKFRSSEYSDADYRPQLTIDYESPGAHDSGYAGAYHLGDTVTVSTMVDTAYQNDVRQQLLIVNFSNGNPRRGHMGWFDAGQTRPAGWDTARTFSDGSYLACNTNTDYGNSYLTPDWDACSVGWTSSYHRVTFVFSINDGFGNVQNNDFDVRFKMGPTADVSYDPGWLTQDTNVNIYATAASVATPGTSAGSWFTESDANGDGLADGGNDVAEEGRGTVALRWQPATIADGYNIYLFDGVGYRKVGQTVGNANASDSDGPYNTWSSNGLNLYPKDSEIAAAGWPGGASGNPFYRAATPDDPAQLALVQPSGYSGSAGLLAGDGSYLYARARSGQTGSAYWQRIDPTTQAVTQFGPSLSAKPALSAFFHNGRVYSGYVTKSGTVGTITGVQTASPYGDGGTITFSSLPLERDTGAAVTASTADVLFACDGTTIYNIAYTLTTSGGVPLYDGFKIRSYAMTGELLDTTTLTMPSYKLSHVLVDGEALYLGEWSGANGARVLKLAKSDGAVINEWSEDQGTTRVCAGFWDATNHAFWLGHVSANQFYKYADASGGRDLRDNPNALYLKVAPSGSFASATNYRFCVVPYSAAGEFAPPTDAANAKSDVALDNRTLHVREVARHTTTDLSAFALHESQILLDLGALRTTTTDLAVASWGPAADVSRTYTSTSASGGAFLPGWRFGFERCLTFVNGSTVDYTDENGDVFRFVEDGTQWTSPNGLHATLSTASSPDAWKIVFANRETLCFDSGGSLTRELDRNLNAVLYDRSQADHLKIWAANGQCVDITFSQGSILSAAYSVTIGGQTQTRQVNYDVGGRSVTYYPGQDVERVLEYAYNAANRLSAVTIHDHPSAGTDSSESFVYDAATRLIEVRYPGYDASSKPDRHITVQYQWSSARDAMVTRYGCVSDQDNSSVNEHFVWNPTGTPALYHGPFSAAEDMHIYTWTYTYSPDNQVCRTIAADDAMTTSIYDMLGNVVAEYDALGSCTSYVFGDAGNPDRATGKVSPLGSTTTYTYDSQGNLLTTDQTLNATQSSHSEYAYGDIQVGSCTYNGALVQEKDLVTGVVGFNPVWAETDFGEFSSNGKPGTTIAVGVQRYSNAPPEAATTAEAYDAFGNLISRADPTGVTTTSTYYLSGWPKSTGEPGGAVSHFVYDKVGDTIDCWRTGPEAPAAKVNWFQSSYDALGRKTQEKTLLSDDAGNGTIRSTTDNTFDGLGNLITSDGHSDGLPQKCVYDARGNVVKQWDEGSFSAADANAVRSSYDVCSRLVASWDPGSLVANVTAYDAAGRVTSESQDDGTTLSYGYNEEGAVVRETSTEDGVLTTVVNTHDEAGRMVSSLKQTGLEEPVLSSYELDLLDRPVHESVDGVESDTIYNSLGWVLVGPDDDGTPVAHVYDLAGRELSNTADGGQSTFDAAGRLASVTAANGCVTSNHYDTFGNVLEEKTVAGGEVVQHLDASYDSQGVEIKTTDVVRGVEVDKDNPPNNGLGWVTTLKRFATPMPDSTVSPAPAPLLETVIQPDDAGVPKTQTTTLTINGTQYTVTRVVDGRDVAQRDVASTLVLPGGSPVSSYRSFDADQRIAKQWGTGYVNGTTGGSTGAQNESAYVYDGANRMVSEKVQLQPVGAFGAVAIDSDYDSNGRLSQTTDYQQSSTATTSYTYDPQTGLLASSDCQNGTPSEDVVRSFSPSIVRLGSLQTGSSTPQLYGWSATTGRLESLGTSANPSQVTFSYNGDGRLQTYADTVAGTTTTYTYAGGRECTRSVSTQGSATTTTEYVYGREGTPLYQVKVSTSGGTGWQFDYLYDEEGRPYAGVYLSGEADPVFFAILTTADGDVVELLDAQGVPFAAYRYDAWGKPEGVQSAGTSAIPAGLAADIAGRQALRFCGYALDASSGLGCFGGDFFCPQAGAFVSGRPGPAQVGLLSATADTGVVQTKDYLSYYNTRRAWTCYPSTLFAKNSDGTLSHSKYQSYFGNFDWYTIGKTPSPGDLSEWKLDHAVSIIVRSLAPGGVITARTLDQLARGDYVRHQGLGYDAMIPTVIGSIPRATSWGKLRIDADAFSGETQSKWSTTSSANKRTVGGGDLNDFYHVRFYDDAYRDAAGSHRRAFWTYNFDGISQGGYWWVAGSCHLDCNELRAGSYPRGDFPAKPPVPHLSQTDKWQWGGYEEWVERDLASRWAHLCGADLSTVSKWDVSRNDANAAFGNACNMFAYVQTQYTTTRDHEAHFQVKGKWWKSSGRATVLFIPPWWLPE